MTAYQQTLTASLSSSTVSERTVPLLFRVLAATADNGTDFLGNLYRSSVNQHPGSNVNVNTSGYWLSKPNPSKFAVESLYFDQGTRKVIDRITLTPITPGIYFTLYYSDDPSGPGSDPASWANLLWTPIYQQFQLNRTQTFALSAPICARFLKVEFTMLQAKAYLPGSYQIPTTFQKYPQWVLDYFLALFATQEHDFISSGVEVTYDALDLAFAYYRDDIVTASRAPSLSAPPSGARIAFLETQGTADLVDPVTLAQIRVLFQPFLSQPARLGRFGSVLAQRAAAIAATSYSTEQIQTQQGNTSIVSNLNREALIIEKGFPVMSFYLPCRHGYRVAQALFENNVAYFAGVKNVVFHREAYTQPADTRQYTELLQDGANLAINDSVAPLPLIP